MSQDGAAVKGFPHDHVTQEILTKYLTNKLFVKSVNLSVKIAWNDFHADT